MNDKDTEFNHLWYRLNAVEQGVTFGRVWARTLRRRLKTAAESWLWPGAARRRSWQFSLPRPVVIGAERWVRGGDAGRRFGGTTLLTLMLLGVAAVATLMWGTVPVRVASTGALGVAGFFVGLFGGRWGEEWVVGE
jgi:hypothetical protein